MAVYPFQFVNRRGSAAISTSGVTVNTANVVFSFPNHAFVNAWYRGTIYINIAQTIPTGARRQKWHGSWVFLWCWWSMPTQAITKYNGGTLTVADIPGTGVYEFWFDRATNTLQIMTGVV